MEPITLQSESIASLAKSLVAFHSEMGTIKKGSDNPFYKSKYASLPDILEAVDPVLVKHKLAIVQLPAGENGLLTMLTHESGEYIGAISKMEPVKKEYKDSKGVGTGNWYTDPQSLGSAITYQRRYSLGAVLSLNIDEDDDGNAASMPVGRTVTHTQAWQQPLNQQEAQTFQLHAVGETSNGGAKLATSIGTIYTDKELANGLIEGETYQADVTKTPKGYNVIKGEIVKI